MKKLLFALLMLPSLLFATDTVVLNKTNFIVFGTDFNSKSVSKAMVDFMSKNEYSGYVDSVIKRINNPVVYIIINSPGGEIESGLEFIQFINAYDSINTKTITLFAASMAFHTVQGIPGNRLITPYGTLMSHKAKGEFDGEFGAPASQIDKRYEFWLRRLYKLDNAIAKRSKKYTIDGYRQLMENEYWCEGIDCVNDGFADKVVNVQCGKDLVGFKNEKLELNFFGNMISVTFKRPDCPLAYPYDIQISAGGKTSSLEDDTVITEKLKEFILDKIMPVMNTKENFNNGKS